MWWGSGFVFVFTAQGISKNSSYEKELLVSFLERVSDLSDALLVSDVLKATLIRVTSIPKYRYPPKHKIHI